MKDFKIDDIGKKMPYREPSDDFFANFEAKILNEVKQDSKPAKPAKLINLRVLMATVAVAATLLIGVFVVFNETPQTLEPKLDYLAMETLSESIDSYLDNMCEAEIQSLAAETSGQETFYSLLP
ncbi:MAG: hypothetical protein SNH01_04765 [Rikenellaceae bacterium]